MSAPNMLVAVEALRRIHACMDGVEWDADTLDAIAEILRDAGLPCREPLDENDDSLYEQKDGAR